MRFFVITGRRHIGKTTFVKNIIENLKESFSIGGVLTTGEREKTFVNLANDETYPYYQNNEPIKEQIGDYLISEEAIRFAENAIQSASDSEIIIIDEFGRLEREKRGLFDVINELVEQIRDKPETILMIIIQIEVVDRAKEILELEPEETWELQRESRNEIIEQEIMKLLEK